MSFSEQTARDPLRLLIPILLMLLIPLAHMTPVGVSLMTQGWVMVGAGGAFFATMMMVSGVRVTSGGQTDALGRAAWILMIVYLVHQFEEYGIDLTGQVNQSPLHANALLSDTHQANRSHLNELSLYRINTLLGWVPFLLAIWAGRRFPWVGLAAAGLMATHGALHVAHTFSLGEYNPGLASALVLLLPASLIYFSLSLRHAGTGLRAIVAAIGFGIAMHTGQLLILEEAANPVWTPLLAGTFSAMILTPLIANILYRLFR